MPLRYDLRHQDINGLSGGIQLLRCVSKHVAHLSVSVYDLAEVVVGPADQQKAGLVHILVQLLLVVVVLQGLIHALYLLHLEHVLLVLIIAVQYVLVEIGVHVVQVGVPFVDPEEHELHELVLGELDQLTGLHSYLEKFLYVDVLRVGELGPENTEPVGGFLIQVIKMLVMMVLGDDPVHIKHLVLLCLVE